MKEGQTDAKKIVKPKAQRCFWCDELTGRCGDDSLYSHGMGPLCEECLEELDPSWDY